MGDTITLEANPAKEPLAGFKQVQPRVFAGLFPVSSDDYEQFRDALEEAQAERLGAAFRARGVDRARLRISLRLPGTAAHGYRAGAARARIRPRPDHQRPDGDLRGAADRRHRWSTSTIPTKLPPQDRIAELREPIITANILVPPGSRRRGAHAVQREARRAEEDAVPRQPGVAAIRVAARRGGARFLRPAQVGEPRLRLLRLRIQPFPGRRRWSSSTC